MGDLTKYGIHDIINCKGKVLAFGCVQNMDKFGQKHLPLTIYLQVENRFVSILEWERRYEA